MKEKYDNDKYWHIWESVMGFGDFARYIIGTNSHTSDWTGCKIGETIVDRKQVFEEFENKLSKEQLHLLNALDPIITADEPINIQDIGDTKIIFKTAIGRKTEEELGLIRTDFKKTLDQKLLLEYETEVEPFLDHNHEIINTAKYFDLRIAQRLIFSKVLELGWNPQMHLSFDKEIGTGRGRDTTPHERIGKKYQWIAYYQYMALLSDNFIKQGRWGGKQEKPYQDPWDPYLRNIDPTILISKTGNYDDEQPQQYWWMNDDEFNWDYSKEDWVKEAIPLPNIANILRVKDGNDEEWLILEGYPSWSEPKKIGEEKWDQPHKELWTQIRSYIVRNEEFDQFKDWAVKQDFMGRWMPESHDRYEMFSREFYWSPAQEYFMNEYYEGTEWIEVHNRKLGEYVTKVNVTAQSFICSEDIDKSKEETISFLKPSKLIYEGMRLKYSKNEGEFLNPLDEVQCFATNVYHDSKSYLLVKKNPFLQFLQEKNLNVVWTVLGEKQIIGGRAFGNSYLGRLEISGAYYFDNDSIIGRLNTKHK